MFRWSERPTRTLRGVEYCFERAEYEVRPALAPKPEPGWRCWIAAKTGERLRVCETYYTEDGKRWADIDAWTAETINDRIPGPFWSVILYQPVR